MIMGRPARVVREVGEREPAMIRRGAEAYRTSARTYAQENGSV